MARIQTYVQDNNITDKDIVLGSDGDNFKKTKNYTVKDLGNYIADNFSGTNPSNQNNIPKSLFLGYYSSGTAPERTAFEINNLTEDLVVSPQEFYFFSIIISNVFYVYAFDGIGKGTYGSNGTQISSSDLQLISKRNLTSGNIQDETSTETIALNNIDPLDISEAVNALNPPVDIQPISEGFTLFTATINGDDLIYLYIGDSGLTGAGQNQTTLDDFELITVLDPNVLQPETDTPPASGTFSIRLDNYLGVDYSGSTTSLTDLDIAGNAVQGGFARIKGNWSAQPTFTGATEAENSNFEADTVIYMYVEKWADDVIYWYTTD